MASTTKTPNYNLSQFADDDIPQWRTDYNGDMTKIDTAIKDIDDKVLTADIVGTGDVDVFVDTQNIKDGAVTKDKLNSDTKLYYEPGEVITISGAILPVNINIGANTATTTLPLTRSLSKVASATVRLTGGQNSYYINTFSSAYGFARPKVNTNYTATITECGLNFTFELIDKNSEITEYRTGTGAFGIIQATFD